MDANSVYRRCRAGFRTRPARRAAQNRKTLMKETNGNTLLETALVLAALGIFSAILLPAIAMVRHAAASAAL